MPAASNLAVIEIDYDSSSEQDCGYTGGVNFQFSNTEYDSATESEWSNGSESDEDSMVELEGDELDANLHELRKKAHDKALEAFPKYAQIVRKKSAVEWKKAEKNRALGYTGNLKRTQQRRAKEAQNQAAIREEAKSSKDPQISMMCNFFKATSCESEDPDVMRRTSSTGPGPPANNITMEPTTKNQNLADLVNYPSDLSNDEDGTTDDSEANTTHTEKSASPGCHQPAVLLRKRQKLDIPYHLESAFKDLEKLLKVKKTKFVGGMQGLQARHARTMESHLRLVVKNAQQFTSASKQAAETHGFAAAWGGHQTRELPRSLQGRHAKVYSLLSDPTIAAELRAYVRSAANEYLHQITCEEMPLRLKRYMELELFPCIHVKVGHGVSLNTAPQANDSSGKSWVFGDEHCLQKKGVSRGIHKSDVICSTTGWLNEASQTLEYGKNYEGYWTGEHFVKQLTEKIIPAFERVHSVGHQALFLINNSQGHSAYSEDALLTSRMNVKPDGKQACMRSGWYWNGQEKVVQSMIFPYGHPKHSNQPKEIKEYLHDNCNYTFNTLKQNMPKALASVPLQTIHRWEHRIRIPDTVASAFD
ncbi:hypothetical protein C8R48DRAFT_747672 [Suillus tomentosus]|nr:hypothetical protein C8R48DRAFT_747672 [Suillus tomentosus]